MPTNEERREVAARLRNMADSRYCETNNTMVLASALLAVTGIDAESGTAEDIMRRLADLIEPEQERTCKLTKVHDWNDEWEPFGYECESCGEGLPSCYGSDRFGMVITPNYCPHCGAKVISNAD